jgi:hypothetical protein
MVGVKNVVWDADAFLVMTSDAVLSRVLPPVVSDGVAESRQRLFGSPGRDRRRDRLGATSTA